MSDVIERRIGAVSGITLYYIAGTTIAVDYFDVVDFWWQ